MPDAISNAPATPISSVRVIVVLRVAAEGVALADADEVEVAFFVDVVVLVAVVAAVDFVLVAACADTVFFTVAAAFFVGCSTKVRAAVGALAVERTVAWVSPPPDPQL